MSRFYGYIWDRDTRHVSLALLPRLRLTVGTNTGIGLQWLTAWFHVWLWTTKPGKRDKTHMIEVLPHVWFHKSRWGAGLHIWWLNWKTHFWFYKRDAESEDAGHVG